MSVIEVSERQQGNPLLKCIRNVKWQFTKDMIVDYVMGSTGAIFVSVKFHCLHPTYAELRVREAGKNFRVRVLLVHVDDENNTAALLELNRICFVHGFTLILGWSPLECARYLETLKEYESKSSNCIQEKVETEFLPRLTRVLTTNKSVNKTDVTTLLEVFGNMKNICAASEQDLILCPGLGEKKVKRLYQTLHQPFLKKGQQAAQTNANPTHVDTECS